MNCQQKCVVKSFVLIFHRSGSNIDYCKIQLFFDVVGDTRERERWWHEMTTKGEAKHVLLLCHWKHHGLGSFGLMHTYNKANVQQDNI
jgi:hypothetical protein